MERTCMSKRSATKDARSGGAAKGTSARKAAGPKQREPKAGRVLGVPRAQLTSGKAVPGNWDDPNDTGRVENYLRRGKSYVPQVYGYRRADPVMAMHRRSPDQVTARHVKAAERLRDDWEISQGVNTGGKAGGREVGPTEAMIDAAQRFRAARIAMNSLWDVLARVVLDGWTVKQWTEARPKRDRLGKVMMRDGKPVPAMSEEKAAGYLIAALACLDDHYNPPVRRRANPIDTNRIGVAGNQYVGPARPEGR